MAETKVFTVIVTWNGEKWISRCLESLGASDIQTRIIVVDNNSTDSTKSIIRNQFPEVELIENSKNLGFGKANNIGIRKAFSENPEYLFLLNQDAWIQSGAIQKMANYHSNNPEFGLISPLHLNTSGEFDYKFKEYLNPRFTPDILNDLNLDCLNEIYETQFVNAAAWLLPKETLEKVGGFNTVFFQYGEDDDYLNRCRYHNLKIGIFTQSSIIHDRPQEFVKISDFSYSKLTNYMKNHMLIDLLDPNITIWEKKKRILVHLGKGIVRNPIAVIHSLFLLSYNSLSAALSYKKSKVPYSYKW